MLNGIENAYFNEFRRSEITYNMRDIRDHLTTVSRLFAYSDGQIRWYVEEGTKIHNDLHHKVEITNRVRYGKLIYIITAFQTIFLPLQTITAIYGMNFDVFPVRNERDIDRRSSTTSTATTSSGCFRRRWRSFSGLFSFDRVFVATNSPQNLSQKRQNQHHQASRSQRPAHSLHPPLLLSIPPLQRHIDRLSAGKHGLPPLRLVRDLRLISSLGSHDQRVPHRALHEERGRRDGDLHGLVLTRGSEVDGDGEVHGQRGRTKQSSEVQSTYSGWIVDSAMNTMTWGVASS